MPVNTEHRDYIAQRGNWQLMRDCIAGQTAIKNGRDRYLPIPNPSDRAEENRERYNQYIERALFLGVTGRTLSGLVGAIFRRDPIVELPVGIEYMVEDCNGGGLSLVQLGKHVCSELIAMGRVGLMVDYPSAGMGLTRDAARKGNLRPVIISYKAEDIINWRYISVGGRRLLAMVVLRESIDEIASDGFGSKIEYQYRVLRLVDGVDVTEDAITVDDPQVYIQDIYNDQLKFVQRIVPRRGDGGLWEIIPFVIMGLDDNQEDVDLPALLDLAMVNIAHYRNSADFEESIYIHGQGTIFVNPGDMTADDFHRLNPHGIQVGSRRGHVLGAGGSATLLQLQPNTVVQEAMRDKEQQMIAIGARLITAKTGNQTAEEARINASAETSALSSLVTNASEGIEQALEYAAVFAGVDDTAVTFVLNQEFFENGYVPAIAIAKMQELDRGLIAKSDYRHWLRLTGNLPAERADEDIDEEHSSSGGGML